MAKHSTVLKDLENNIIKANAAAGQYRLDEAVIDYGGVSHGISAYVQKIYLFEDIHKFGITGWVELLDSDNLISGFFKKHIIAGQELLKLKFRTYGSHLPVDCSSHPLHIHKIENLRQYDPGTGAGSVSVQQYRLHFCSPELLTNDRVRVSKAYEGKRYDEMVEDILKNYLKTKKDVWLEKTQGKYNLIVPNMHPFDAINFIAKKCKSTRNLVSFNFYETTKGFRFKGVHNQLFQGARGGQSYDWQMRYTFSPARTTGDAIADTVFKTAVDYSFLKLGDTYTGIKDGMFSSKSIYHDSYHKRYDIDAIRYTQDLPLATVSALPIFYITSGSVYVPDGTTHDKQVPDFDSVGYDEFPDSRVFYKSSSTENAWNSIRANGKIKNKSNPDTPLQDNLTAMQRAHDKYLEMKLEVHGLSGLQVGDSIELKTPTQGPNKGLPYDERWSIFGYYITKLLHKIDLRASDPNYKCEIVCSPFRPGGMKLPSNAKHAGKSDTRTGKIQDFSRKVERTEEAD